MFELRLILSFFQLLSEAMSSKRARGFGVLSGGPSGANNQQNQPTRRNFSEAQSHRLSREDRRENRDQNVLYEGGNYPSNAARQRNLPIPGGSHGRNHASHRSR